MISCQHCGSENVRIQGQATLSAPGELMYKFSKSNLRRKDVYLMGVNWETCDIICGDCSRVTPAYGNYVSRMEKEIKRLTEAAEDVVKYCDVLEGNDFMDKLEETLAATKQKGAVK